MIGAKIVFEPFHDRAQNPLALAHMNVKHPARSGIMIRTRAGHHS
jgi:hypothetical protein